MKRKFEVRRYEYNLTQPKSKWFFTKPAALLYAWYIEYKHNLIARVYSHE